MKRVVEVDPRIRATGRDLMTLPVVIRVTDFSERAAERFAAQVSRAHTLGQPVLPVVVDSFGGDVYALLAMVQEVQNSRVPVATVCESKAMSAGAILFACGSPGRRYMAPDARLMLHSVSGGCRGKAADLKADAQETDALNVRLFQLVDSAAGRPPGYFLDLLHKRQNTEWYLTAREAKKIRLCDHVGVPTMTVRVAVSIDFK